MANRKDNLCKPVLIFILQVSHHLDICVNNLCLVACHTELCIIAKYIFIPYVQYGKT